MATYKLQRNSPPVERVQRTMLRALPVFTLSMWLAAAPAHARLKRTVNGYYTATAYSTPGETADGGDARRRKIAADPDLLPLGSRIRLSGAGSYSGEYVVGDTGPKIQGRKLDIFIPGAAQAKRFGKRRVRVQVLELAPAKK